MSNALENARKAAKEASAKHWAAHCAHVQLKRSGPSIDTQKEKALIAAGLPMPANSYTYATWLASYNAVHTAAKAAIAAREVVETLVQAEMLEKLRETLRSSKA